MPRPHLGCFVKPSGLFVASHSLAGFETLVLPESSWMQALHTFGRHRCVLNQMWPRNIFTPAGKVTMGNEASSQRVLASHNRKAHRCKPTQLICRRWEKQTFSHHTSQISSSRTPSVHTLEVERRSNHKSAHMFSHADVLSSMLQLKKHPHVTKSSKQRSATDCSHLGTSRRDSKAPTSFFTMESLGSKC